MPADSPEPPPDRLLRCTTCGRLLTCSADDATEFILPGWPECCGEVMTYYRAADKSVTARFPERKPEK
jgi:hypothetical protein